ncbi:MAG TPA: bifunctional glycosyltransferase/class I SAM-dependent methyltransferase [Candidatus Fimivivens sp.]|nr:bifunctional glycosyltransferase/class I SAM-dependent methyltransferase [Candidatus Fimivivens sp.]
MESTTGKRPDSIDETAREVFAKEKVALFIVAYNAQRHIVRTIERIPEWSRPLFSEIFVIDDSSEDDTVNTALNLSASLGLKNLSVMKTPKNQGYGGNQKIGYTYAVDKGYDIVILLHGDGQYPPENLPDLVAQYADPGTDAVFGSRMITRADALRGGMPPYKWIGNQVLTTIENGILGTGLSEFHSGYRSYRTRVLRAIPFHLNSDDFHFDTDIIIQLTLNGSRIIEIPMPTHYGNETCHVNGLRYAWNCLKSVTKARLHRSGLFFQPNFEFPENDTRTYRLKKAETSLHTHILSLPWKRDSTVLDFGANDCGLAKNIAGLGPSVTATDRSDPGDVPDIRFFRMDLNEAFDETFGKSAFDTVIALDIIEHLSSPEDAAERLHRILNKDGTLYASTANIGYVVMRLTHLFGWFNYGKKGILDRTHHRLFTVSSFRRLLEHSGFQVTGIRGFGPPIADGIGNSLPLRVVDRISTTLARIYPNLFAFNFLVTARRIPSIEERTAETEASRRTAACPGI